MADTRDTFLSKLLDAYASSYDIAPAQHPQLPLAATAHCHVTETQYALFKSAVMNHSNNDEYVYFFTPPHLTDELCRRCIDYAYEDGMAKIDPADHHMCTRLVALFLCDSMDDAAAERLKKCRIYKSFQFSLQGWMEFHTAAVDFGKESVVSNQYGRDTAKFLKNALHPEKKKGKNPWGILKQMLH